LSSEQLSISKYDHVNGAIVSNFSEDRVAGLLQL
jgi:hypothetical protein